MRILFLLLFSVSAHAADFKLKGVSLGDPPSVACKGEEITDKFGEVVRAHKDEVPALRAMGTNECMVPIDTFGGFAPSAPVHMLFKDNRLILMKIEMESLSSKSAADLITVFHEEHGAPKIVRSAPFITQTWRKNKTVLEIENTSPSWDDNNLIIILRDEVGYKSFTELSNHNQKQLGAVVKKSRRSMITE